ncbi:hypothetical protein AMJ87_13440 [candidate division WOR_3 bacterium SM23_60]|uniref:Dipeptidylpeptidase IV N-terminal domain-containing protein n=1 Tax=candidate division WOR_3 bacterium SM23_60 TaxID=1703780 RepID=A0A0S8G300_UNCW3|nr:MAG: hypothetical protein AMJ87_13440 [candidate division WOR_3 bacterium SM23_60]
MIFFFCVNMLVFQSGDTLFFEEQGRTVELWVLGEEVDADSTVHKRRIRQAKVSPDNRRFLVHTFVVDGNYEYEHSEIVFYSAAQEELLREAYSGDEKVLYESSGVYDSLFIVAVGDKYNRDPSVRVIADGYATVIFERGTWQRIVSVELSSNNKYLVFHTRKHYSRKLWDYIYFKDLTTLNDWEYQFPTCLSCKRTNISLAINDDGQVEAVHKAEHRVFSKEGKLIDIFLQID